MVVLVGWRSNAIAAKRRRVSRWSAFADREIRRSGNWKILPVSIMRPSTGHAHMIKLTAEREITAYKWVYPDDKR